MNFKTIKMITAFSTTLFVSAVQAQELPVSSPQKVKEIGIGFTNFNSYNLQYRWGNEKRIFRINGEINSNLSKVNNKSNSTFGSNSNSFSPKAINSNLNFSIIYLKPLDEKAGFIIGPNIGIGYSNSTQNSISNYTNSSSHSNSEYSSIYINPNIGIVLGVYYKFNAKFSLYGEILPNIGYSYQINNYKNVNFDQNGNIDSQNTQKTINKNVNLRGLSTYAANFTFVYRISNK